MRTDEPRLYGRFEPIDGDFWAAMRKRAARRVHGLTASPRDGSLMWRREEERDLLSLLVADTSLDRVASFPEKIRFAADGQQREWVPAVGVRRGRHVAYLDAMRAGEDASIKRQDMNAILERLCRSRGISYLALPRAEVLAEPRFSNAKHVLACRAWLPSDEERFAVVRALSDGSSKAVLEIANATGRSDIAPAVFAMGLRREISLDLQADSPDQIRASLRAAQ